ncbi:MAG: hypothetical protein H5T50_09340 [Nitrososphaeria archaeon]|nr:hypothetical protein [Nitrososphaeria archaeon]
MEVKGKILDSEIKCILGLSDERTVVGYTYVLLSRKNMALKGRFIFIGYLKF